MKEIIQQLNKATSDIEKLKSLPNRGVSLQSTTPGTADIGNENISGTLIAGGSIQAGTTILRAGIAMNNTIVLDKICRVYDDATSRISGYTNNAIQVSGVTDTLSGWITLPSTLKAVKYDVLLFTAAAGTGLSLVVENPDAATGSRVLQGSTVSDGAIIAYSGGSTMSLSSLGRLSITYRGTANLTRIIINIIEYIV